VADITPDGLLDLIDAAYRRGYAKGADDFARQALAQITRTGPQYQFIAGEYQGNDAARDLYEFRQRVSSTLTRSAGSFTVDGR
jgi:hypothetical protein